MKTSFDEALRVAREKYPHPINHYEEYEDYYVFDHVDGMTHDGGSQSPIVIRKSDMAALNYAPIFFNMDEDAEDVGDIIAEGEVERKTRTTKDKAREMSGETMNIYSNGKLVYSGN